MEQLDNNDYITESHSTEIDINFSGYAEQNNKNKIISKSVGNLKSCLNVFKNICSKLCNKKNKKTFSNILYVTLDCPPYTPDSARGENLFEYIREMRKQYPEHDIRIIIPIINQSLESINSSKLVVCINGQVFVLKRTDIQFEFFLQNRINSAAVYKFPNNYDKIQVYGICSPAFSLCNDISKMSNLKYLAPFIKSLTLAVQRLDSENFYPDIIHVEDIPFFLGGEFSKVKLSGIKVWQTIKDFTMLDMAKTEAFWAAINLADKSGMKKLCQDKVIKKCIAALFNIHHTKHLCRMEEYLRYIYKNYYRFKTYISKSDDVEENVIFKRLNARTLQLFPDMRLEDDLYYYHFQHTIKHVDYWTTTSKTYYNEILNNPLISGKLYPLIKKTKDKSNYILYGIDTDKYGFEAPKEIYQNFNLENFRQMRKKNKSALLKQFNLARIRANFIDPTLFVDENYRIEGALDIFFETPLLFAYADSDVFSNGIDILFNTILKLFELHKNVQVIICIKDGLKVNFIKSWVEFLQQQTCFDGKWVFIDGQINLSKFYAASDMTLIPRRINQNSPEHYIAMHYGCVPIVSKSGILNDTVQDIFDNITNGCGFKTNTSLLCEEDNNTLFLTPVLKALNIYQQNPSSWNLLVKNCLTTDCSWNFSILEKYHRIYNKLF